MTRADEKIECEREYALPVEPASFAVRCVEYYHVSAVAQTPHRPICDDTLEIIEHSTLKYLSWNCANIIYCYVNYDFVFFNLKLKQLYKN